MSRDLIGERFGHLVVIEKLNNIITQKGMTIHAWVCKCDCGNIVIKYERVLMRGYGLSCGCFSVQDCPSREKLYNVWTSIKQRCYNQNDKYYENYGGRGIIVCDEWKNDYLIFREWAYENGYNPEDSFHLCTVDRIDVNGNYCPDNCRIVSRKVQNDNTTRTIYVTHNGETHTLKEWSNITGICLQTIYMRIYKGHWEPEVAITTPVNSKYRNKNARNYYGTSA